MKRPLPTRKIRAEQAPEWVRRGRLYSGAALHWARCVLGMVLLVVGVRVFTFANTTRQAPDPTSKPARSSIPPAAQAEIPQAAFNDITSAAGIDFRRQNGARGEKLLPETLGGGCEFFDYDSDGDQDLLFVNSQSWFADEQATSKAPATMALYRNDGSGKNEMMALYVANSADMQFTDEATAVGLGPSTQLELTFGLGMEDRAQSVTIHWPDGSRQIVPAPQVDRAYEVEQGGKPVASLTRLSEERRAPIAASVAEESRRVGRRTLLADAPTSCGDYLQTGSHAASRKHRSSDRPRTCHGPTCSKAPLDHRAPPTAPSRSQRDQQDALSGTHHLPALAYLCGLVPADSDALLHFATDRIFRPPRCC